MILLAVRALYRYMISFACVCVFTMQCIACHEFYISKKLSSVPPGTSCPLKKKQMLIAVRIMTLYACWRYIDYDIMAVKMFLAYILLRHGRQKIFTKHNLIYLYYGKRKYRCNYRKHFSGN